MKNKKQMGRIFGILLAAFMMMAGLKVDVQAAPDNKLHSVNLWNADGSHGSGNATVWKNASTSVSTPQIMYAWFGDPADSYSLFCIDYGKAAHTGDAYATQDDYSKLNWEQKNAIGYVLGCAQRVQAPRYNGSFNDYGGEVTMDNFRLYYSTQLMIWYYIDKYYTPGTNEGIGWDGVVMTCNAGWGNLAECERIKNVVDNIFTYPSFASKGIPNSPVYEMTYNPGTRQYELLLQDTNPTCTIGKYTWSGQGVTFTRCNANGDPDGNGTYLKLTAGDAIASAGTPVVSTNQCMAQTGNITYIKNQTSAQDLVLCTSSRPDPVQAYFRYYANPVYGQIELRKTDSDTGKAVSGATYRVYGWDGSAYTALAGTMTDNGDGSYSLGGLQITSVNQGRYKVVEEAAPYSYMIGVDGSWSQELTLSAGQTEQLSMTEKASKGQLRIYKTGDQVASAKEYTSVYGTFKRLSFEQQPLRDVEFEIYDSQGTLVDTVKTGSDGYAVSKLLDFGTYTVVETKTRHGLVTGKSQKVTITCPDDFHEAVYTQELSFENQVGDTEINVYKQGEILNIEDGTYSFGKKPLQGVIFGVYTDEDILDWQGNVVIKKDECIGFIRTGLDGKATLKDALVEGNYYYKEVKTLDGYILDSTKKNFKLVLGNEQVTTMDVNKVNPDVNQLYKAKIQLVKCDQADHTITLADVKFELYKVTEDGDVLMGTYTTDQDGKILLDGLPMGNYYFKEVQARDGYILDDKHIAVLVNGDSDQIQLDFTNEQIPKTPDTPKTGDAAPVIILIAAAFSFGILFVVLQKKRKQKS